VNLPALQLVLKKSYVLLFCCGFYINHFGYIISCSKVTKIILVSAIVHCSWLDVENGQRASVGAGNGNNGEKGGEWNKWEGRGDDLHWPG